jgi:hypothetical protein
MSEGRALVSEHGPYGEHLTLTHPKWLDLRIWRMREKSTRLETKAPFLPGRQMLTSVIYRFDASLHLAVPHHLDELLQAQFHFKRALLSASVSSPLLPSIGTSWDSR